MWKQSTLNRLAVPFGNGAIVIQHFSYQNQNADEIAVKQRTSHLKRKYDLSQERYAALLASQGGACAICKQEESAIHWKGKPKMLYVDHDHATGEVRGLLCDCCNRALGYFHDNVEKLRSAICYLEKSS